MVPQQALPWVRSRSLGEAPKCRAGFDYLRARARPLFQERPLVRALPYRECILLHLALHQIHGQWVSQIDDVSSDVYTGWSPKRWRVKWRTHGDPQSDDVSSDVCTWWSCLRCSPRTPRPRAPKSWCTYVETRRTGPILARERERRSCSFVQNVGDGVVPAEARGCKILLGNFFSHLAVWSVFLGNNWELILDKARLCEIGKLNECNRVAAVEVFRKGIRVSEEMADGKQVT
jgi:hypothetical protein